MVEGFQYYTVNSDKYFTAQYRRLKRRHGAVGCGVVDFIIAEIYKERGYYITLTPDVIEDVAEYWDITDAEVVEIVRTAISVGIFDSDLYARQNILTSVDIQSRYLKISATLKRKNVGIIHEFSCSNPDEETNTPEQFGNDSGNTPEQFGNDSDSNSISISISNSRDKGNSIDDLNNNVVVCKNLESAADGDTQQREKKEIERYFFVERRWIQAERIAERFWNLNAAFNWRSAKTNKPMNPIYAAKEWRPAPEEMGGHACDNKLLAGKYFDFVKSVEHLHPEAWKLLREFNNIQVETDRTFITYNDSTAGDILDTILINNRETAFKAFRASFGAKTITYLTFE